MVEGVNTSLDVGVGARVGVGVPVCLFVWRGPCLVFIFLVDSRPPCMINDVFHI